MEEEIIEEQEYPLSAFNKIFYSLLAAGMFLFAVYLVTVAPAATAIVCWVILALFTAFAVLLLANLRCKVVISNNSIINVGLFSTKELPLEAAKGCRVFSKAIVIEPISADYPRIVIGNSFNLANSDRLEAWIKTRFKDLNAEDLAAARQQLLEDGSLGHSAAERQKKLTQAKTVAGWYNFIAVIAAFISLFFTSLLSSELLLLVPLAGIYLVYSFKGLVRFVSESARSIYPGVFFGVTLSSFILLIHSMDIYSIVAVRYLWIPALLMAGIILLLLYKRGINPTAGILKAQVIIMLAAALLYGFGSARELNCAFDRTAAQPYQALVQQHWVTSGKHTAYHIKLGPWGPQTKSTEVEIGNGLYRQLEVGDTVEVQLKPGLLQVPWFWVEKREDQLIQGVLRY